MSLTGCQPPPRTIPDAQRLCPSMGSIEEAAEAINERSSKSLSLRSDVSRCTIKYYTKQGRQDSSRCTLHLRTFPPDRLYFMCEDLGIKILIAGTNPDDFWFCLKPREINAYWQGKRADLAGCAAAMWFSPGNLLEAFGVVRIDRNWTLAGEGNFDIVTRTRPDGSAMKKIYIDRCDYLVGRIEYFDRDGVLTSDMVMTDYFSVEEGMQIPARVRITSYAPDGRNTDIEIALKNVKLFMPTEQQLNGLFAPPGRKGYEHVYELGSDCKFFEQ